MQISLKSKRRPRNASEGELSIQSKLRDRLHPEDPGTLRIVQIWRITYDLDDYSNTNHK